MRHFISALLLLITVLHGCAAAQSDWKAPAVWQDGLVEKAVYEASRVVYGKPRAYTAIFLTNQEQHDLKTLTKSDDGKNTIAVWKFNQIEDIPTPNYTYHYVTTSHLTVDAMQLTRLDCSSQEFCGTSFKQFLAKDVAAGKTISSWDHWAFSYMPQTGRKSAQVMRKQSPVVSEDALAVWLRGYDFEKKAEIAISLIPSQKNNRPTEHEPVVAVVRHGGLENGDHKLELVIEGRVEGTYWLAADRLHVMTKYVGADGQQYVLKEVSRVNYWTIKE